LFKEFLTQMSPLEAQAIATDKALFHRHCAEHHLPTVPILCVVSLDGAKGYPALPGAATLDEWRSAMANAPDQLFIKPIDGALGEGAFAVSRTGGRLHFADRSGSLDDLFRYLLATLDRERGWLVQPLLRSDPRMASIMAPRGLGTVRAITYMDGDTPRMLLAIMKITVGDNVTDNFHNGSTGNLVARIDMETGELDTACGSVRKDWPAMMPVDHHPDTGHAIKGFTIPGWPSIVSLALKAQHSLRSLRSAGWDIAVTSEGPVLVETNAYYSVDLLQVAYRRGLKQELMQLLDAAAAPAG
jgi:hypothetical protein